MYYSRNPYPTSDGVVPSHACAYIGSKRYSTALHTNQGLYSSCTILALVFFAMSVVTWLILAPSLSPHSRCCIVNLDFTDHSHRHVTTG